MNERERFLHTMRYEPVDRRPLHLVGPWADTLERWYGEGLPRGVDLHEHMGLKPLRLRNVSGTMGMWPLFETRTIEENETTRVFIDRLGRTVRDFKDHTSMPEWLDFPVKDRASLERVIEEHFRVDNLDERFTDEWDKKIAEAAASDDLVLVDGGCYYGSVRSIAGVEGASYLFYDAPDLLEELFERYHTVVMEGIRRATARVTLDLIGFGEDIAYKNGPLISPTMFREFILPRYRSAMDAAHSHGVELTWYDSDGDVRALVPGYLEVGINGVAPCEVAAGMVPTELRARFGRELRIIGGIDKREVARGRAAIDAELERNRPLIEEGGFVPAIDHSISADISWDNYQYFVERLLEALKVC